VACDQGGHPLPISLPVWRPSYRSLCMYSSPDANNLGDFTYV
jgi:hypothetical protein